jgi:ParB/RepB/Spo0J family partition protein
MTSVNSSKKSLDLDAISQTLDNMNSSMDEENLSPDAALQPLPAQKAMAGKRPVVKNHRTIISLLDPSECKRWTYADRFEEWFTYENTADIIESIRAGSQEIPGVVRELSNDPEGYKYEVIYGGRRHFATEYLTNTLGIPTVFEAVIKSKLSDKDCAGLMDIENRNKADISDFERCVSYRRQIGKIPGYDGVVSTLNELRVSIESEMVSEDGKNIKSITKSGLSQMVAAGELNEIPSLISLFEGRRIHIPWSYAYQLMRKWNDDNETIKRTIASIKDVCSEMSIESIFKELLTDPAESKSVTPLVYKEKYELKGRATLDLKISSKALNLKIPLASISLEADDERLLEVIRGAISDARKASAS